MEIKTLITSYDDPQHGEDILTLLNEYACDPMGGGEPLSEYTKQNLISELASTTGAFSVLCYADGQPVGLANCFQGLSTFQSKPLINIHDIVVIKEFRGKGISRQLLSKIEKVATQRGCCKITLEVLEGNESAISSYKKFGFIPYELSGKFGHALFWEKKLVS